MSGYREFGVGEVLTSSNVNDFLMQQSVMKFADSAARDAALGTAVGGSNALREGMVAYLDDTDAVEKFDGTEWSNVSPPSGFDASETITASDASWSVPALGNPIVRVTVIGGGGGGGSAGGNDVDGGNGGSSSFTPSGGSTISSSGGSGGAAAIRSNTDRLEHGANSNPGFVSGNQGQAAIGLHDGVTGGASYTGADGTGGEITVAYVDLTGVSTANVVIGSGGSGGNGTYADGGDGGRGEVIVEYKAA